MSEIRRVLFVGSKKLGLSVLQKLHEISPGSIVSAVTLNDVDDTRSCLGEFSSSCEARKIPLEVTSGSSAIETAISKHRPDWCIVCGWYRILPAGLLASVAHGFAGIHASLLPSYRGSSPLVWALIRGEKKVGISLFKFDHGVDDGPLYFQCETRVAENDTIADVQNRLEELMLNRLEIEYPAILDGSRTPVPQSLEGLSYCAPRKPDDGRIDWKRDAAEIHNFVRAQSHPYPGAFTYLGATKIHIWKTELPAEPHFGLPGQMIRKDDCSFFAGCAPGTAIRIMSASIDGVPVNPAAILKSFSDRLA
jgi:methionyl-tRNA formyltransferase